jgi:hypothetical protein
MRKVLHPHKITGKHTHFYISLLSFQIAGRKTKDYAKTCSKHYTKLIPYQFLDNMTCMYFHCYHSFNLEPYNQSATHSLALEESRPYPDSITYSGMSKLNWGQRTVMRNTNHPLKTSTQGSVANSKNVTLKIPHKIWIILGLYPWKW